jgi:hypothetical protein
MEHAVYKNVAYTLAYMWLQQENNQTHLKS